MMKTNRNIRTVLAALAATTTLPTMALAQDVEPSLTTAAPVETPAPVTTSDPLVVDAPAAPDPLSPANVTPEPVSETPPVAANDAPKKAAPVKAAPAKRILDPVTPSADRAPVTATPAPAVADPAELSPIAEAAPVIPDTAPVSADASVYADLLPLAGAAALGLIALAALGMSLRRRKPPAKSTATEVREPTFSRPLASPPARSSWTPAHRVPVFAAAEAPRPSQNRIEQALRGPTPDNPFLSLKKRLKRAAFFDQRERQVRAGLAERVSPMAGLPRRLAEKVQGSFGQPRYQIV